MGFLRFCRRAFMVLKVEHTRSELLVMYRLVVRLGAIFDGLEQGKPTKPPPLPRPSLPPPVVPPLTLF
jgi:hypothetical protein